MRLILGSSSKIRATILKDHAYEFTVIAPDIDEKGVGLEFRRTNDAKELTMAVANAKADELVRKCGLLNSILITSDQVVVFNGRIREKPRDKNECRAFLKSYRYSFLDTVCAFVLVNTDTGERVAGFDTARQHFNFISDEIIEQLVDEEEILFCAGGFMIEHPLLIDCIGEREGELDSIQGMPMSLVKKLLREITKN